MKNLLMITLVATMAMAQDDVQLFEYTHPTHKIQVDYVTRVAEQMFMRQRWDRHFDGEACPETSILICKNPDGCKPVDPPPSGCDLPENKDDPECITDPTCVEKGTCPIPVCEVPIELRVEREGVLECEKDFCKDPANADDPRCKEVDLCDLIFYHDNLEKCKELPPDEPKCKKYPELCVIPCDLTGDYSPCEYEVCDTYPFLPHCNPIDPPPPVCTDKDDPSIIITCCEGPDCDSHEDQCKWAWKIGSKSTQVSDPIFTDTSKRDSEGNIFLECLNEVVIKEQRDILFECFKEGVEIGSEWTLTTKDKIHDIVDAYKGNGELVSLNLDENSGSASISEEKREQLEF